MGRRGKEHSPNPASHYLVIVLRAPSNFPYIFLVQFDRLYSHHRKCNLCRLLDCQSTTEDRSNEPFRVIDLGLLPRGSWTDLGMPGVPVLCDMFGTAIL